MLSKKKCYLCGNRDFNLISNHTRDNDSIGVIECKRCHLFQADSFIKNLSNWYETSYREDYQLVPFEVEQTVFRKDAEKRLLRIQGSLDLSKRSLLDIGCGDGTFLKYAKKTFHAVAGVEPHQKTLNKLQQNGFKMFSDISKVQSESYDTFTLFQVLEHIPDPVVFLRKIGDRFPGGILYIEIPCVTDALIKLYRLEEFMEFYWQAAHLFYFSFQTIKKVITKAGFSNYKISQINRYGLRNHLNWLVNKKPGNGIEFTSIINDEIEKKYCIELSKNFLSDSLWAEIKL